VRPSSQIHDIGVNNKWSQASLAQGIKFVALLIERQVADWLNCTGFNAILAESRDSSVGIATGYELNGGGSIPDKGGNINLLHSVQTGSRAHPTSCPVGTRGYFPAGIKRQGLEADHSMPFSVVVKNGGAVLPLSIKFP
jgi:hypothetical protein